MRLEIGDIVFFKEEDGKLGREKKLYIIVDISDTKYIDDDNEFELMRVYPVQENSEYKSAYYDDLSMYAKTGSKNSELIHSIIKRDRTGLGLFGEPDFIKIIKGTKNSIRSTDKIDYTTFTSVDECLDVINDMKMLNEMFDTDEFSDVIKAVGDRIREIAKLELIING